MITRIFGKTVRKEHYIDNVQKTLDVSYENNEKIIYTGKPELKFKDVIEDWHELCSFEGAPRYNKDTFIYFGERNEINISSDETVKIEKEIFRADLNELHMFTNKTIELKECDMEHAESELEKEIKSFNKTMIESNGKLKAYCDLHKLFYEDTDCIELFKLVFPDDKYVIEDGVMKVKPKLYLKYSEPMMPYDNIIYVNITN